VSLKLRASVATAPIYATIDIQKDRHAVPVFFLRRAERKSAHGLLHFIKHTISGISSRQQIHVMKFHKAKETAGLGPP